MSIHTGKAVEGVNDTLFKYPNIIVLRQDGARDYLGSMGQEAKTSVCLIIYDSSNMCIHNASSMCINNVYDLNNVYNLNIPQQRVEVY